MKELQKIYNKYLSLTENHILNFHKFNNYAIVHHSNSIESSSFTIEETMLLLDENLTPNSKPLEHTFMAIDHYDALKYVLNLAENKQNLTSEIIKKTSSLILKNTEKEISAMAGNFNSAKGDFRKLTVVAGDTTFMDYKKVPNYVEKLVSYINENINKSDDFISINKLAFDAHYQMVTIHPFADGNGRLSRLIMNYVQQYHSLPLSIVYSQDKIEYFNVLSLVRKKEDLILFYDFMFKQLKKYLKGQILKLENKPKPKNNKKGFTFLY